MGLEVAQQSVVAMGDAGSVGIRSLLGQLGYGGSREALQSGQSGFELAVLPGGGLVERRGLRAELHVDRLAVDLIGPFEVRAVTQGGVPVAGAVRVAALHHPFQDGAFQEIPQLVEFPASLAEARIGGGGEGRSRCLA